MNIFRFGTIAAAIFATIAFAVPTTAQTVTTLYSFPRPQGSHNLLVDKSGVLFGTSGGHGKNLGSVFELTEVGGVWKQHFLYKFSGSDGQYPGAIIEDSTGALYGTTSYGGVYGKGVVFMLTPSGKSWTETILHSFGAAGDGTRPARLILDKTGILYGTTSGGGGPADAGTVFELTQSDEGWTETILHSFNNSGDGSYPFSTPIFDGSGNMYGTTGSGGTYNNGAIYELKHSGETWTESVIYSFTGGEDGFFPEALVSGGNGTFYGVTEGGGISACPPYIDYCGVVFELIRAGGKWTETVLHSFGTTTTDGILPITLIKNPKTGFLYGVTQWGGTATACDGRGCGTVFELTQTDGIWTETLLHSFPIGDDGWSPGSILRDSKTGIFYGTTAGGYGTVFQMTP